MYHSRPYKQQYSRAYPTIGGPLPPTTPVIVPGAPKIGFWQSLLPQAKPPPSTGTAYLEAQPGQSVLPAVIDGAIRSVLIYLDSIPALNNLGKAISESATHSRKAWGEEGLDRLFAGIPPDLYSQLTGRSIAEIEAARKALGVGGSTGSRFPTKSGTSGNCSWDTKGGWCWKGTACGGSCTICRTGYATTNINTGCNMVRSYFLNNYRKCKSCATTSGTGATVRPTTPTGCPYSGCTSLAKGMTCFNCRCQKLCQGKGGVKTVKSDGSCYCKGTSSNIPTTSSAGQSKLDSGCSYSGCNEFHGMTRCTCRCRKICANRGGVKTVTSNGSCYCKGSTTTSKPTSGSTSIDRLTSGCSYSGCNSFTGMTRCRCRCSKICASKGGVKTVTSNGSCYCNRSS